MNINGLGNYSTKSYQYPDHGVDPELKLKADWHLKYAEAMYSEHLRDQGGIQHSRREEWLIARQYSQGMQDTRKYMVRLGAIDPKTNNRKGYSSVSWDIVSIAPKLRSVVIGMLEKIDYNVESTAIDPVSSNQRADIKWGIWAESKLESHFGPHGYEGDNNPIRDMVPAMPKNLDELQMMMESGIGKLGSEIAIEALLDWSFYMSNWDTVLKRKIYEDFYDIGIACTKDYVDPITNKVKTKYIDIANFITSYSRDQIGKNANHGGVVEFLTISQLRKDMAKEIANGTVTEDDFAELAKKYAGYGSNPDEYAYNAVNSNNNAESNLYNSTVVAVLNYECFSYDVKKYEERTNSRGDSFVYRQPYKYKGKKKTNRKPGVNETEMVYKGKWVIGSKMAYDYGHQYDVPKKNKRDSELSFRVYKAMDKSMATSTIPFIDLFQMTWIKMQNALAKSAPSGLAVEFSTLSNISLGGNKMSPLDILEIRRTEGDLIYSSRPQVPGEIPANQGPPIFPIQGGVGAQLDEYIKTMNHCVDQMRGVTGINDVVDSTANPHTAVGVAKTAVAAANNVLSTIFNGYRYIKEETAKNMALRWQIVARDNDMSEHYTAIGETHWRTISANSDITYANMAIKLEMRPTEDEVQSILNAAREAQASKKQGGTGISTADFLFIQRAAKGGRIKYAEMYLGFKERKDEEARREEQLQNIQAQGEQNQKAAEAKTQGEAMKISVKGEEDRKTEAVKSQGRNQEYSEKHMRELDKSGDSHGKDLEKKQVDLYNDKEKIAAESKSKAVERILSDKSAE
jgi:hypothetical protein